MARNMCAPWEDIDKEAEKLNFATSPAFGPPMLVAASMKWGSLKAAQICRS